MPERAFEVETTSVALNVLLPVETTVTSAVFLLDEVKAPLYPVSRCLLAHTNGERVAARLQLPPTSKPG